MRSPFRDGMSMEYPVVLIGIHVDPFDLRKELVIRNFPHADHLSRMEFMVGEILGNERHVIDLGSAEFGYDSGSSERIGDISSEAPNVTPG